MTDTVTIEGTGSHVLFSASVSFDSNPSDAGCRAALFIDGSKVAEAQAGVDSDYSSTHEPGHVGLNWWETGLSAGDHTFEVRWYEENAECAVLPHNQRSMQVVEFKASDVTASILAEKTSTAADTSITSSYETIDDLTATVTTTAGGIQMITASVSWIDTGTDNAECDIAIFIDGSKVAESRSFVDDVAEGGNSNLVWWESGLSAGSHTFEIRAKENQANCNADTQNQRHMQVVEFSGDYAPTIKSEVTGTPSQSFGSSYEVVTGMTATPTIAETDSLVLVSGSFSFVDDDGSGDSSCWMGIHRGGSLLVEGESYTDAGNEASSVSVLWAETGISGPHTFDLRAKEGQAGCSADTSPSIQQHMQVVEFLGADRTPNTFDFTDQTGVATSTLVESDIELVTGIDDVTDISIDGVGSSQYRICTTDNCSSVAHDWSSSPGSIDNDEYVQLRLTSSQYTGTATVATLTVGTANVDWSVTTSGPDNTPDAFDFTDQTDVALSTLVESDKVLVEGMEDGTSISIDGVGSSQYRICTNNDCTIVAHDWSSSSGSIDSGEYVQLRLTSADCNSTETVATLTVGTSDVDWSVTTEAPTRKNVATATNVGNFETYTLNFGWTATAGRLLVLTASWNEDAISISEDSGEWRKIYDDISYQSVTGAMYYKVADGTETSVSLSWIGEEDISIRVGEYSGIAKGDPLDVSSSNNSNNIAVKTLSSGTTAATSQNDELAIAMMASADYDNTESPARSWSNDFSEETYLGSGSDPGLSVAEKTLTSTGTVETTFTTTDTGDQMAVFVATFKFDDCSPGLAGLIDLNDAAPNTQYTNKAVALDLSGSETVSVSGDAEVRNVTDASGWLSSVSVDEGDTIEVRMTSSASNSTAVTTTVTMGSFTQVWTITTMAPVSWIIGSVDALYTSPDGTNWTLWDQTSTFPAGENMDQLEYGDGYWLLGSGESAALFESTDGVNWTDITPAEFTANINGILYHMGIWYVRTDSKNFASTDRVNWTDLGTAGDGGSDGQQQSIKGGKHYVVISRNSSTSGSHDTWTSPATTIIANINFTENTNMSDLMGGGLAYQDGVWVAGKGESTSPSPYYTTGAATGTWTASNASSSSHELGFGNGIFTIIRGDYALATDPSTWSATTYESSLNPRYGNVFGDGLFVSVNANLSSVRKVAHSTDGITYTAVVNMDGTYRTLEYGGAHNEPDDFTQFQHRDTG
jgi:hypothetical protein